MASTDIYDLMKLITPYNTTTSPEQNPYNPTQEQLGLISWFQVAFCQVLSHSPFDWENYICQTIFLDANKS